MILQKENQTKTTNRKRNKQVCAFQWALSKWKSLFNRVKWLFNRVKSSKQRKAPQQVLHWEQHQDIQSFTQISPCMTQGFISNSQNKPTLPYSRETSLAMYRNHNDATSAHFSFYFWHLPERPQQEHRGKGFNRGMIRRQWQPRLGHHKTFTAFFPHTVCHCPHITLPRLSPTPFLHELPLSPANQMTPISRSNRQLK